MRLSRFRALLWLLVVPCLLGARGCDAPPGLLPSNAPLKLEYYGDPSRGLYVARVSALAAHEPHREAVFALALQGHPTAELYWQQLEAMSLDWGVRTAQDMGDMVCASLPEEVGCEVDKAQVHARVPGSQGGALRLRQVFLEGYLEQWEKQGQAFKHKAQVARGVLGLAGAALALKGAGVAGGARGAPPGKLGAAVATGEAEVVARAGAAEVEAGTAARVAAAEVEAAAAARGGAGEAQAAVAQVEAGAAARVGVAEAEAAAAARGGAGEAQAGAAEMEAGAARAGPAQAEARAAARGEMGEAQAGATGARGAIATAEAEAGAQRLLAADSVGASSALAPEVLEALEARLLAHETEMSALGRQPASLDLLAGFRPALEVPPAGAAATHSLWRDYVAYWHRRFREMEAAQHAGMAAPKPPLYWEAYSLMRNRFREGLDFQQKVSGLLRQDASLPAHQRTLTRDMRSVRVDDNVGLRPASGKSVTYADQLVVDEASLGGIPRVKSYSCKKRSFQGLKDETVVAQVEADAREALKRYGGDVQVRRRTHPLFGRTVRVSKVYLVYEAQGLATELRELIRDTAMRFGVEVHFL